MIAIDEAALLGAAKRIDNLKAALAVVDAFSRELKDSETVAEAVMRMLAEAAAERDAEKARADALAQVLRESNAACICGCPEDVHDRSGEDPDECGTCEHECLPCSAAVADAVSDLRQRERALVEALRACMSAWTGSERMAAHHLGQDALAPYDKEER